MPQFSQKKLFLALLFMSHFNFILNEEIKKRGYTLYDKVSHDTITDHKYYISYTKKSSDDNNITGTGNLLKDITYRTSCLFKECEFCCKGNINAIKCGSETDCDVFLKQRVDFRVLYAIVKIVGLYLLIPIFWVIAKILEWNNNPKAKCMLFIMEITRCIMIPPYGIVKFIEYCRKGTIMEEDTSKLKKSNTNNSVKLFELKQFDAGGYEIGGSDIDDDNPEEYIANEEIDIYN